MRISINVADVAQGLSVSFPPTNGGADLFGALLGELAKGSPVSRETLAAALGWSAERMVAVLERIPSIEYDNGQIVGCGLTLRETRHVFEIDGNRLYTWCALDALMFPALIGRTARVLSPCAATDAPVCLTVAPDCVRNVEPEGAVVSLVLPDASPDVRRSFCCHVHFFASAPAAESWVSSHGRAMVVSVEDAFRLGQELARQMAWRMESEPS
jgi:alkylmercury lyase